MCVRVILLHGWSFFRFETLFVWAVQVAMATGVHTCVRMCPIIVWMFDLVLRYGNTAKPGQLGLFSISCTQMSLIRLVRALWNP